MSADNPYQAPQAAANEPEQIDVAKRPVGALHMAAWATAILFAGISAGLLLPLSELENGIASGKLPALPQVVLELFPARHCWHILTACAFAIAAYVSKHRVLTTAFQCWTWLALGVLWTAMYMASFLTGFYVSLHTMLRFGFDFRAGPVFAVYAGVVAAIILLMRFWPGRADRRET